MTSPGLDRWQEAAERLTAYVQIRSTARGLDNELLHAYNYVELRMSDLSALLGVVDRHARQLAAVRELAEELGRYEFGKPLAHSLLAALAGGETNNDH